MGEGTGRDDDNILHFTGVRHETSGRPENAPDLPYTVDAVPEMTAIACLALLQTGRFTRGEIATVLFMDGDAVDLIAKAFSAPSPAPDGGAA